MNLPQFVIIGAAKAATTWLTTALRSQPAVFMPAPEVHFFNRNYDRGLDWYASNFAAAGAGQVIGEKSASYLSDPLVPARLKAALPNARLIVQLRNPVDRAYSDYCMLLRRGEVDGDIGRHLDPAHAPLLRFLNDGLYASHLLRYLNLFPREQIHVLLHDDIARDPARVLAEVADFIGIGRPTVAASLERRVKDKEAPMLPLPLRRLLRPLKGAAAPLRGHPVFRQAHAALAKPIHYPSLEPWMRRRMVDYYASDIRALEGLLRGRDLGGWLQAGGAAT